ncbi:hypothetical protein RFI_24215 [Reticulomyxa filosa]|uniref:Uncharacterized protein n=1 Tax=Reticulomyxa filosa TaxID=46433 RepID=X6MHK5_RETFI|nr:hypothetical protein RFI_24215 [Reticulomyxa filosa]|eukprot:ETO13161.1 hypothetical protein RFI_24215 [Reticulomyxa filosa]
MDTTHKYKEILRSFTVLTCVVACLLEYELKPNNEVVVCVLFGLFGFFAVPLIAVSFECTAESTFPVNEELSNGILMAVGNLVGVVYVLIWGSFLPDTNNGKHLFILTLALKKKKRGGEERTLIRLLNFTGYFYVWNLSLLLCFIFKFNGDYHRMNAEKLDEQDLGVDSEFNDGNLPTKDDASQSDFGTSGMNNREIGGRYDPIDFSQEREKTTSTNIDDADAFTHSNPNASKSFGNVSTFHCVSNMLCPFMFIFLLCLLFTLIINTNITASVNPAVTTVVTTNTKKKKKKKKNKLLDDEDNDQE